MKLRQLRCATFTQASLADLQLAVNDYLSGIAVLVADSGTVAYAANEVGQRQLVDQSILPDAGAWTAILWYTET